MKKYFKIIIIILIISFLPKTIINNQVHSNPENIHETKINYTTLMKYCKYNNDTMKYQDCEGIYGTMEKVKISKLNKLSLRKVIENLVNKIENNYENKKQKFEYISKLLKQIEKLMKNSKSTKSMFILEYLHQGIIRELVNNENICVEIDPSNYYLVDILGCKNDDMKQIGIFTGGMTNISKGTTNISDICSNKVIVVKEENKNDFFITNDFFYDEQYVGYNQEFSSFHSDNFIKKFYSKYQDKYDFLVIMTQKPLRSHFSVPVNRDIKGIGLEHPIKNKYTEKLGSLAVVSHYDTYTMFFNNGQKPDMNLIMRPVIFHEIAHHRCCVASGINGNLPAHRTNNLDLFNGDINKIDPMAYNHRVIKDSKENCVDQDKKWEFSNISLYLMGLVPSTHVFPILVHEFEKKNGDDNYNTRGPNCGEEYKFTEEKSINIFDIINSNGKRIPDYSISQKKFNLGYVVLVPYESEIDEGFFEYVQKLSDNTPSEWSDTTNGNSSMTTCH